MRISFTVLELVALVVLVMFAIILVADHAFAVGPTPEARMKWKAEGTLSENLQMLRTMKEAGACRPAVNPLMVGRTRDGLTASAAVDTAGVLVLLVEFPNHKHGDTTFAQYSTAVGEPADFDSILFSDKNPTGSMTDYYLENSYGKVYITGKTEGWYNMPANYGRYVPTAGNNAEFRETSRALARDAINRAIASSSIDFTQYDVDGDRILDGLIILHAGRGAEEDLYGIWSHQYSLDITITTPDGITIRDYIIGAEDAAREISPIGVITHEFGHLFGLPDLYDTNPEHESSDGLGAWSLMASGNYNGLGRSPAHLDAWCKAYRLRWAPLDLLRNNLSNQAIPAVEFDPAVYVLVNNDFPNDMWFVENRQQIGFDVGLPGSGLCIYHFDVTRPDNNTPGSYKVELLQADGLDNLGFTRLNSGDGGDPWPGRSNNRNFHDFSVPSSNSSDSSRTGLAVWNISDSDSIMYADIDIEYSRPWIELDAVTIETHGGGGVDDIIDVGDTVYVFFTASNYMRETFNYRATLTTLNKDVDIIQGTVSMPSSPSPGVDTIYNDEPIKFVMPDSIKPTIDFFTVAISSDSLASGTRPFSSSFSFSLALGRPTILLVDDDRGAGYDSVYSAALTNMRQPHDVWHTGIDGEDTPSFETMSAYSIVFWHTGESTEGALSPEDIAVMKSYLDDGGGLFLSSISGLYDMQKHDPSFLADYLSTSSADDSLKWPLYAGAPSSSVFNGLETVIQQYLGFIPAIPIVAPAGAGEGAFVVRDPRFPSESACSGVSFTGSFKTVFVSFGLEFIDNERSEDWAQPADSIIARAIDFFGIGYIVTSVNENDSHARLPRSFSLKQNYPNPFNPATIISYSIKGNGSNQSVKTKLSVYNMLGREVVVLVDEVQRPGDYTVNWDGTSSHGGKVATGVYLYRLTYDGMSETKKMVLLK